MVKYKPDLNNTQWTDIITIMSRTPQFADSLLAEFGGLRVRYVYGAVNASVSLFSLCNSACTQVTHRSGRYPFRGGTDNRLIRLPFLHSEAFLLRTITWQFSEFIQRGANLGACCICYSALKGVERAHAQR